MMVTTITADAVLDDAHFGALSSHVIAATGLVFYVDRPQALARHVAERLTARGLNDCRSYCDLLQDELAGSAELDQLVELLTIGETYFFRHQELFAALRGTVLPEIIARNQVSRRLRIWSAGCSNGAEAYSLAILLRRDLAHLIQGWNISILGTDINRAFLAQAAAGQYEAWAFRGTPPELRQECFEQHGNTWRIARRFHEGVAFHYHNLASQPFRSPVHNLAAFDLVLCRNVLIYFASDFVESVISQLAESLVPIGWLAVGHAEHGRHLQAGFEAVSFPGATVYRKLLSGNAESVCDEPRFLKESRPKLGAPPTSKPVDSIMHGAHFALVPRRSSARSTPDSGNGKSLLAADSPTALQKILALADAGQIDAALELCSAQVAREPLNPIGYFYEALLSDLIGQHAAALRSLRKAVYLDRTFVLAHYYSGLMHEKLGHLREALTSFHNVAPLLDGRPGTQPLADAGGLTVHDLQELASRHIDSIEEAADQ